MFSKGSIKARIPVFRLGEKTSVKLRSAKVMYLLLIRVSGRTARTADPRGFC